jgi:hypothetical protein
MQPGIIDNNNQQLERPCNLHKLILPVTQQHQCLGRSWNKKHTCITIINTFSKFIDKTFLTFVFIFSPKPFNMNLSNLRPWQTLPKLVFMSALLSGSISSSAQTNMVLAVAPVKMNVFYIGVDNPVAIAASGATDEKVAVTISGGNGSVSKVSAGSYIVRVTQPTDDCIIRVDVDGKPAGTSQFRVRALPSPTATVGGFASGSNVPAGTFRVQAGVGIYLKDFPFDVRYEVVDYTFTVDDDNGGIKTANSEGASFSDHHFCFLALHITSILQSL